MPSVLATVSMLAVLGAVLLWNAVSYQPAGGYDASEHIAYANLLVQKGVIPGRQGRTEYYTPPGFYALAGSLSWVGRQLGLAAP